MVGVLLLGCVKTNSSAIVNPEKLHLEARSTSAQAQSQRYYNNCFDTSDGGSPLARKLLAHGPRFGDLSKLLGLGNSRSQNVPGQVVCDVSAVVLHAAVGVPWVGMREQALSFQDPSFARTCSLALPFFLDKLAFRIAHKLLSRVVRSDFLYNI